MRAFLIALNFAKKFAKILLNRFLNFEKQIFGEFFSIFPLIHYVQRTSTTVENDPPPQKTSLPLHDQLLQATLIGKKI